MSPGIPEWMVSAYSSPRLAPYLRWCDGDVTMAVNLYHWNVMVSAAFYGPLHTFEMALRNSVHNQLSAHFDRADWWESVQLQRPGPSLVDQARQACQRRKSTTTPDDMITELTFGFWVSLTARRYDRTLWVPVLRKAFPGYRGRRDALHEELESLRLFRNRIMHYEPIHRRHLEKDHAKLYRVLSYISPEAASGIKPMDRVPEVLMVKEQMCRGDLPPSF
ncbi:hypothetical protein ACQEU5_13935 [Marinactinospora thermotolerans]|uniref:Abi-like protein n=1 Tax=Marinactinospora thermotolerans DSM 45154 TaxID=1122192 RepID=A0A1T4RVY7_9ACTN|nr:hypothetical protein [Marinactinospora thermotolerans]SKA20036.1 hypothetical protein SAMN02745673_03033 [Marinactinospora thermotolerans DSM 45154]